MVCLCNEVSKATIEEAIRNGARKPIDVFDQTMAGVGACGGTCRPKIQKLLDSYAKSGEFPETLKSKKKT